MPNRQLTKDELDGLFAPLFADVRARLAAASNGDGALLWAMRRKLAKELTYLERGKPMQRRALKARKRLAQLNRCAKCGEVLPESGPVLDRLEAMGGYTDENTRLLCSPCDTNVQKGRGYA